MLKRIGFALVCSIACLIGCLPAHADEYSSTSAASPLNSEDASFVLSSDYSLGRRADAPGLYRADVSTGFQAVSSRLPGAGVRGDLRGYVGLGYGLSANLQADYVDLQSKVLPGAGASWAFYSGTMEDGTTSTLAWTAGVSSNLLLDGTAQARYELGMLGTFRKELMETSFNFLGGLTPGESVNDLRLRAASGYYFLSNLMVGGETDSVWAWGPNTGTFGQALNAFAGGLVQYRYQRALFSASVGVKYLAQDYLVDGQTEAQANLRVGVGL